MRTFFLFPILIGLFSCTLKSNDKPNVLLIVIDDLGWKDLGFMGSKYYETPNLDAFSKEGMLFFNAYASASNCAPSRASMLSGMFSPRHGVYTVGSAERGNAKTRKLIPTKNIDFLSDSITILHEMFKNAGYITSNFGKWHIGENPKTQGVDVNIAGGKNGNPGRNGYFSPYNVPNITDGPEGEYLTDRLTNETIEFISNNTDIPFFAYLPYYTVHTPILTQKKWSDMYKNKKGVDGQSNSTYGGMVSAMDHNVGRLFKALDSLGLYENTIVIFTSDNGGLKSVSSQQPLRAGKGSYYEGGIRVPLVIRWPGRVIPSTVKDRVTNMDFYPTLQEIVQPSTKTQNLDGISILPLLKNESLSKRDLFWHFPIYLESSKGGKIGSRDPLFRTRPGSIIISGEWKLHHYYEDDGYELYNLSEDPGEQHNLRDTEMAKYNELKKKQKKWIRETEAPDVFELNPLYDEEFSKSLLSKQESSN